MPQALSRRERECVVGFVEEGHSRREAARVFKTAPSTTVRIVRRFRETGCVEARPRGGFRHGKLPQHRDFILKTVAIHSDMTMPELAAVLLADKAISVLWQLAMTEPATRASLKAASLAETGLLQN